MLKRIFWCFLMSVTIVACIEEAKDVDIPVYKPKFVVSSFISPSDTICYLSLGNNIPIFGNTSLVDTSLQGPTKVLISDGNKEIQMDTASFDGYNYKFYPGDMPIVEGKTYSLKVFDKERLRAEASCTVPFQRDLKFSVDTVTSVINTDYSGTYIGREIKVKFTDFPGEINYYRVSATYEIYTKRYISMGREEPVKYVSSIQFENELISDKNQDGKEFYLTSDPISYYTQDHDSIFIKVYLLTTDEAYYNYHKSLKNYNGSNDPFSEATLVYSNISGGLGIFSAYSQAVIVMRLP